MNRLFLLVTGCLIISCTDQKSSGTEVAEAGAKIRIENPVIPGDFADPSVIRVGSTYYAVGTSSEWAPHFPVFKSENLEDWQQISYVFQTTPKWASSSFWAPELFYQDGIFYVYYTARRKEDGVSLIGVATSENPEKGFEDHGILLEFGKEAIDAFVIDDGGQLYISWKAYGLDERPIELLASRLSNDGLKLEGEPFSILKDENGRGIEGQYLVKKDNFYYLFYSEGACCGSACDYDVRVARSKSIKGPFVVYESNPLLQETANWKCPGHGTMVETPDGSSFYMYHAYSQHDDIYTGRQGLLKEVFWQQQGGWPSFKKGDSFADDMTGGVEQRSYSFSDDFENGIPKRWQWDFRNAQPSLNINNGTLILAGETEKSNNTGTALTVRPYLGTYEIETEVLNTNVSLKGLVLYGDVHQAVGIGTLENKIQLWEVKEGERKILNEISLDSQGPVQVKIAVEDGFKCRFYWKSQQTWEEIQTAEPDFYDGRFLPQWDRSARPGLIHKGEKDAPGHFCYFKMTYKDKDGEVL